MGLRKEACAVLILSFCLFQTILAGFSQAGETVEFPVPGKVTFVDFGAKSCIPCKMMEPIIEDLRQEYRGRVEVIFVDVWEQKELARGYSIRTIPTQVFFDKNGIEAGRHEGFLARERIVNAFKQLGVE